VTKHEIDCLHWVGAVSEVSEETAVQRNIAHIYNLIVDNTLQCLWDQLRVRAYEAYTIRPLNAEGSIASDPKDIRKVEAQLIYLPAAAKTAIDARARQQLMFDMVELLKQLHKEPFQRFWDEISAVLLRADAIIDKYREK
jgi:hypothetical protein